MQHGVAALGNDMEAPQILDAELQYDLAIAVLGRPRGGRQDMSYTDICTPMFMAGLFTIVKRWGQPQGPVVAGD